MRVVHLLAGLCVACATSASAQVLTPKKKVQEYTKPKPAGLSEQQWDQRQWDLRAETDPSDFAIRENVVESETNPFLSRFSVWADATMPWRSKEFGAGKLSYEAMEGPTAADRAAASKLPEADYPGKAQDNAILAAVYRYFFGYRSHGFAKDSTVYFLGLGPHLADAPQSLIAALQRDPVLKKDGVTLRPATRSFEVTDEAIRDRDTGAYGPVFRVDGISLVKNGEAQVVATFSEREGFWFTRVLTLRQDAKTGAWQVVRESDYPLS
jgi:hypothetical protein